MNTAQQNIANALDDFANAQHLHRCNPESVSDSTKATEATEALARLFTPIGAAEVQALRAVALAAGKLSESFRLKLSATSDTVQAERATLALALVDLAKVQGGEQ